MMLAWLLALLAFSDLEVHDFTVKTPKDGECFTLLPYLHKCA